MDKRFIREPNVANLNGLRVTKRNEKNRSNIFAFTQYDANAKTEKLTTADLDLHGGVRTTSKYTIGMLIGSDRSNVVYSINGIRRCVRRKHYQSEKHD